MSVSVSCLVLLNCVVELCNPPKPPVLLTVYTRHWVSVSQYNSVKVKTTSSSPSLPICLRIFCHTFYVVPLSARGTSDVSPPPPPHCLESQDSQFDPAFLYLLSLSSALSCHSFCLILFCFWLILLNAFSLNLHFPKGRFFCVALVFVLFEQLGDECFSWWYDYAAMLIIFFLQLFSSVLFYNFFNLVLKR